MIMKKILIFFLCLYTCIYSFSQEKEISKSPVLYLHVDEMPKFIGGQSALKKFIDTNLQWPAEFDGQGTVLTSFIVTKDGSIKNIIIEKGLCNECNNEAIRVIKLLPKWSPGKVNHRKVDVIIYLPIKFKME